MMQDIIVVMRILYQMIQEVKLKSSDDGEPRWNSRNNANIASFRRKGIMQHFSNCNKILWRSITRNRGLVRGIFWRLQQKALQKVNYIEKKKGKEAKITVPYSEAESIRYYCEKII